MPGAKRLEPWGEPVSQSSRQYPKHGGSGPDDGSIKVNGADYIQPTAYGNDGGVHQNSIIVSHAAYLINQAGITKTDLAKLWYQSMQLGYDGTATWITV